MSWQLKIGANPSRAFAALNCSGLRRTLKSQDAGEFSFTEHTAAMDGAALANLGDTAQVLWIDDATGAATIFFQGKVTKLPRKGSPKSEAREYVITDAWHDLERVTYQQQWSTISGADGSGNPTTANENRSELILGMDAAGNPQNSDAAIRDVLAWAAGCGVSLAVGTILGGGAAPVPYKEIRDLPCASAIQELLHLTPDAVTWLDYTTTPPTFHVERRGRLGALAIPIAGIVEQLDLTPRNDIQRSAVVIRYVAENETDGIPSTTTTVDAAPAGASDRQLDALVATVRIAGSNATYQKQAVETEVIPTDNGSDAAAWWHANVPSLKKLTAGRFTVSGMYGTVDPSDHSDGTDIGDYPRRLVNGAICSWMASKFAQCTYYATLSYDMSSGDDETREAARVFGAGGEGGLFSISVTCTSCTTRTYYGLESYTNPEPVPAGLAAILYGALGTLHYEGSIATIQAEVDAAASGMGSVINITGSLGEWQTMNALVQTVTDDLDIGRRTYHVGPPHHLTIHDLMEQLRYTRTRSPSGHIGERKTGAPAASGAVDGPVKTPHTDSNTPGSPTAAPQVSFAVQDAGGGNFKLGPGTIQWSPNASDKVNLNAVLGVATGMPANGTYIYLKLNSDVSSVTSVELMTGASPPDAMCQFDDPNTTDARLRAVYLRVAFVCDPAEVPAGFTADVTIGGQAVVQLLRTSLVMYDSVIDGSAGKAAVAAPFDQ